MPPPPPGKKSFRPQLSGSSVPANILCACPVFFKKGRIFGREEKASADIFRHPVLFREQPADARSTGKKAPGGHVPQKQKARPRRAFAALGYPGGCAGMRHRHRPAARLPAQNSALSSHREEIRQPSEFFSANSRNFFPPTLGICLQASQGARDDRHRVCLWEDVHPWLIADRASRMPCLGASLRAREPF